MDETDIADRLGGIVVRYREIEGVIGKKMRGCVEGEWDGDAMGEVGGIPPR